MSPVEPTEAEITDFIDGRLSGARRDEVERWLADHPGRAREVERQRQLNDALKDLGVEILDEPVPDRLREVLNRPSGRDGEADGRAEDDLPGSKSRWRLGGPIGAIALILIGIAMGWIVHAAVEPEPSPVDALLADASYTLSFYTRDRNYAIQFPPDRVADFAAVSTALFDRQVDPPDLQSAGFKFRGARIAPVGRRTSSFFFFENQAGETLTVVFWPENEQELSAPEFRDLGEISAQFWFSRGLAFAVMGETDQERLSEIGDKVVSFYGHKPGS